MPGCWSYCFWRYCFEASSIILLFRGKNRIFCAFIKFLPCTAAQAKFSPAAGLRPSKVFVHLFQKVGGPGPAATRARWACPCGGAPARGASPKQSFRPPFSKGGGFQRQRLWPPSADGGTLYTLGVFGGLGAFTRERPPRPLPIPPAQAANGLPAGEVAPQGPEGALARRLAAPSVEGNAKASPFRGHL